MGTRKLFERLTDEDKQKVSALAKKVVDGMRQHNQEFSEQNRDASRRPVRESEYQASQEELEDSYARLVLLGYNPKGGVDPKKGVGKPLLSDPSLPDPPAVLAEDVEVEDPADEGLSIRLQREE
jgi:hypothetical protein